MLDFVRFGFLRSMWTKDKSQALNGGESTWN
jgi:hypothetical protein